MTIRDDREYTRVLLYSYNTTITGWGVLLIHRQVFFGGGVWTERNLLLSSPSCSLPHACLGCRVFKGNLAASLNIFRFCHCLKPGILCETHAHALVPARLSGSPGRARTCFLSDFRLFPFVSLKARHSVRVSRKSFRLCWQVHGSFLTGGK